MKPDVGTLNSALPAVASEPAPTRRAKVPQERGEDTRQRIIEETVACVLEEGFSAASASRVATRAGVTWGVIQYHFGGRDGLLRAVIEYGYEGLTTELEQLASSSASQDIGAVVQAAWDAFSAPAAMAALEMLVATRGRRSAAIEEYLDSLTDRMRTMGMKIALGDGEYQATHMMWLALRGMILGRLVATAPSPEATPWELAVITEAVQAYVDSGNKHTPTGFPGSGVENAPVHHHDPADNTEARDDNE